VDVSFGTVWEGVAARLPEAVAVSEPDRDYTYAEFDDRASRLAAALEAAGVGPGDTVACYLYNGAAYLETVFAAFKIGAIPVNANYRYTQEELTSLLQDADAAAVVFSGALAGNLSHAAAGVSTLRLLIRVGAAADDAAGPEARELAEILESTPPRPNTPRPGSDQLFMYTGDTTGRRKASSGGRPTCCTAWRCPSSGRSGWTVCPPRWTRPSRWRSPRAPRAAPPRRCSSSR
jgi:3-oxocholest-4-en-26-oate---CoA ligase